MALVLKDRVKESSTTSGTGTITLGGAFVGFQTFNSAVASGSTVYYTIHNTTAGNDQEWEVGVGTFTAPNQLTRDTVFSSSAGGSKVSFSGSSVLEVFITQPAEQAVYINDATGKVEVFGNGTNVVTFTEINTTNLTANTVTLTAGTITTNAANSTDITNKQYVDGLFSQGVSYHEAVLVESPTNLVAVYNQPNGAGNGVGATLTNSGANVALSIDGVSLSNTARVLVYTQSNAVQNGIYTVTNPGAPDPGGAQWVLTRATDADTFGLANPNTLGAGDAVFVQSGNTGAGETYVCTTAGTITFGSSNITFAQISSAQIYAAGTGLNLSNLTFSIANTAVTAATYGAANAVGTFTVNAQGQITNAANTTISIASNQINDAIPNSGLANSNVVVNGTTINLGGSGTITANTTGTLTIGSYLTGGSFNGGANVTVAVDGNSSNSANTVVVRDANGAFAGGNITAANFIGDGTAITAINASNISSGTIANARTTAASANGASTIVQRDSGGNFSANTITANISGDISGGTNINASNITSGTIANARTTASSSNGASTIVLRGASGEFSAGAITGASFSGNGSAITAINATAITTGTIDNARTTASASNGASTIVLRDANGDFAADAITANFFIGDGSNVSAINGSNVTTGTVANARTTAASANGANTIVSRDANGSFSANIVTATFTGNGATITDINASNLTSGTVNTARISGSYTGITGVGTITAGTWNANVIANAYTTAASANGASTIVARDASGNFTANAGTFTSVSGNGVALTAINASNISSGTIANARTTASDANGASTIVSRDANGSFAANVVTATTFSGGGGSISAINASNISTGTIANARTTAASANGASTIVARDTNGSFGVNSITGTGASFSPSTSAWASGAAFISSGSFWGGHSIVDGSAGFSLFAQDSGANLIIGQGATSGGLTERFRLSNTGTVTATTFSGSGASLTNLNASNLSSGTVATARLAAGTANSATYLRGDQNWATAVSNVATGTGLTGGPVTTTGTISLANTAVTPGSYTYASITVDAQGRLTAASSGASPSAFPAGTVMLFAQTAAPTGWTKNTTTGDNSALRVTTGVAGTGGSVAFTTAFASQAVAGTIANTTATGTVSISAITGSAGATTLSTPQIPSHTHYVGSGAPNNSGFATSKFGTQGFGGDQNTGATGGGASHTHPFSFSSGTASFTGTAHNHTFTGTAINLAVQYIDVIRATKD